MNDRDLSAMIGSRLCHDLVSPLGAIGNGLELLAMTQPASPELDMASEAVKVAQDRVRLFRLAFGKPGSDQSVSPAELEAALSALAANGRLTMHCALPGPMPRDRAKRLALGALCLETAMPWGGDIEVTQDAVRGTAERLKIDEATWGALQTGHDATPATPALIHFAVLAQTGLAEVTISATSLRLSV